MTADTLYFNVSPDVVTAALLRTVSVEVFSFDYIAREGGDDTVVYLPKFPGSLLYNSFLPEITVDVAKLPSVTSLTVTGRFRKSVRVFMYVWFSLLIIFEATFIAAGIANGSAFGLPAFIPVLMGVFALALSFGVRFAAYGKFVKEYELRVHALVSYASVSRTPSSRNGKRSRKCQE